MADDAMFRPLTPGERPAAAAASNRKRKNHDWTPIPVPDDVLLPDGKIWPEVGMPFPLHSSLGKPTDCLWFHNAASEVVGGECRFEIDEPADAKGAAGANGARADAADAKFPHRSGAAAKKEKTYRPLVYARRDDGQVCDWRWQGLPKPYPLFGLPRLMAERDKRVLITEGARKAVAADALFPDFVPTAMLFGAEAPAKSDCSPLAGRVVAIWPDNDDAGWDFAREVAALLRKAGAASVCVVTVLAHFPPKWDLCDARPDGVTVDDLRALLDAAVPVEPASDLGGEGTNNSEEGSTEPGQDLLADIVERAKADVGVAFEDTVLRQLAGLRIRDRAGFIRLRAELKAVAKVPLGEFDKALAAGAPDIGDAEDGERPSQATMLVQLALKADAELFHNAAGDGFVTVQVGGHGETWPVRSKAMRLWLTKLYFDFTDAAPNSEALQAAINTLGAIARFEGTELPVYLRVGEHDGRLYLDLCDRDWRAVEIGPDGWRIISNPPIRFRRTAGMLPLPLPEPGGSLENLRPFLNVRPKTDEPEDPRFVLATAWLLAALHPRGPYPILGLAGEQGTAKSSFARVLRELVDPNSAPLRSLPRENRDLFIAATNGHVIVFDNVSDLLDWLSDSLCRLATGGGFATRQLYTDGEEVLFFAIRPIILNGIEDFVSRPDLADRSLLLTLEEMPDDRRRAEREFWTAFEGERPRILGALLDAVAHGLKMLPHTKLAQLPRMADFALWISACEGALWSPGTFMAAYDANRDAAVETVLEADAVATTVRSLMSKRTSWEGTATDLLSALNGETTEAVQREKKWPKDGRAVSGRLRRATPGLRQIGITVERDREGKKRTRTIILCRVANAENGGIFASASSAASAVAGNASEINSLEADAKRTQTCGADANDAGADTNDFDSDGPNPLENGGADAADEADANSPSVSEPWRVDL